MLPPEIAAYYERGDEPERLTSGPAGQLEFLRTQALLDRLLPAPPAAIADVGGGAGIHAVPLAQRGYEVHLLDPVPLHVEQAAASEALASASLGDARALPYDDERFHAALLLGPLYHLPERADRIAALAEARRVVRPGGLVAAAAISRFASTMDGIAKRFFDEEGFEAVVERDLRDGRHTNPGDHPRWFTTAYFHLPEDLPGELEDAGLEPESTLAIEGPAWLMDSLGEHLGDPERRERLLRAVARVESAPSLLGASAHLLAVGRRPTGHS
jgi:ubiquinone/menaquinone biosynthesis C-methylase UbiE